MAIITASAPTSLPPSGTAGGDLGGTYPNPTVDLNTAGGTMNGSLAVVPATNTPGLTITSDSTNTTKLLDLVGGHTGFALDNDGTLLYSSDDFPTMEIRGVGTGANFSVVGQAATSLEVFVGHSFGLTLTDHNSGQNYVKLRRTFQMFSYHSAPADGDLSAGECALWFDQTNGAAMVKLKSKSADGTVVNEIVEQASPITSGALPTATLSSGAGAQLLVARAVEAHTPITTDATNNAASCAIAISPDNSTYTTLCTLSLAAAVNLVGAHVWDATARVPAGWYLKLTVVRATIGTTTYY